MTDAPLTRPAGLYVGARTDAATHERTGETVGLDPASFTTHGVIVGMTGSGKTGLGMVFPRPRGIGLRPVGPRRQRPGRGSTHVVHWAHRLGP